MKQSVIDQMRYKFCKIHFLGHENVTKLLIENGADVNARNDDNRTPLFYSVTNGIFSLPKIMN